MNEALLKRAKEIAGHNANTVYPSRVSAGHVREVITDLLEALESHPAPWISVPREPTDDWMERAMRSLKHWLEPTTIATDEYAFTQFDCDQINGEVMDYFKEQYRAFIAAAPESSKEET